MDITMAGAGRPEPSDEVSGTWLGGVGLSTTIGEVVLGGSEGIWVGNGVDEILRSARVGS
jgi:hypothetical protein